MQSALWNSYQGEWITFNDKKIRYDSLEKSSRSQSLNGSVNSANVLA